MVHGAGRIPNLANLDLDAANIAWSPRGVDVSGHLQSNSNPAVYAAGVAADTPGRPLTPVAVFEGKIAASNMLKGTAKVPDYTGVPTTVFTIPELKRDLLDARSLCVRPGSSHNRLGYRPGERSLLWCGHPGGRPYRL